MNVVIPREELVKLIGKIQNTVSSKPSIPVLANILIEAQTGSLVVSATDLTVSMRFSAPATVIEEGKIALPARRFFQLIREIRSPQVKITSENGQFAEITAASAAFRIHGMHFSEFPALPDFSSSYKISLPASSLKELLHRTIFCAAREDSRYVLNGVLVEIADGMITFTGTDGKRLARMGETITIDPSVQATYILPLKAVEETLRVLDDPEETVHMHFIEDKASIEVGSGVLMTKLLSGQYPDVKRVIPQSAQHNISLHREELLSLLKQIALFTSDHSHSIRFIFAKGELTLKGSASNIGEGVVSMPADFSNGTLEIAFNPFYFIDILRRSQDECILFSIQDAFNPGLITDSTKGQFVIMPMRLEEPQNMEKERVPTHSATAEL